MSHLAESPLQGQPAPGAGAGGRKAETPRWPRRPRHRSRLQPLRPCRVGTRPRGGGGAVFNLVTHHFVLQSTHWIVPPPPRPLFLPRIKAGALTVPSPVFPRSPLSSLSARKPWIMQRFRAPRVSASRADRFGLRWILDMSRYVRPSDSKIGIR